MVPELHSCAYNADAASRSKKSTPAGFEPTREKPSGFRVHRLNHSAMVSLKQVPKLEYTNCQTLVLPNAALLPWREKCKRVNVRSANAANLLGGLRKGSHLLSKP